MAGFDEALALSVAVRVDEYLKVRVASPPGPLLKLVAGSDRRRETNKTPLTCTASYRLDNESELLRFFARRYDLMTAGGQTT